MSACQLIERSVRWRSNAGLAKARAAGAGGAVRAEGIELDAVLVHSLNLADNSALGDDAYIPALPQWPFRIAAAALSCADADHFR